MTKDASSKLQIIVEQLVHETVIDVRNINDLYLKANNLSKKIRESEISSSNKTTQFQLFHSIYHIFRKC
jgi:hypothetical protein